MSPPTLNLTTGWERSSTSSGLLIRGTHWKRGEPYNPSGRAGEKSLVPARVEVYFHSFLTLELDVGEWSVSRLARFTTGKTIPRHPLNMILGAS